MHDKDVLAECYRCGEETARPSGYCAECMRIGWELDDSELGYE